MNLFAQGKKYINRILSFVMKDKMVVDTQKKGGLVVGKLMRMLALTKERELSCGEVNDLIDYFIELEQAGEDVNALLPEVVEHLRICGECREEYEALQHVLGIELNLDLAAQPV